MDPPVGPTVRKLLEAMEASIEHFDPARPADRLEHLGRALIDAATKLRTGDPQAFSHLTPSDIRILFTTAEAHLMAWDLLNDARAVDAEGN